MVICLSGQKNLKKIQAKYNTEQNSAVICFSFRIHNLLIGILLSAHSAVRVGFLVQLILAISSFNQKFCHNLSYNIHLETFRSHLQYWKSWSAHIVAIMFQKKMLNDWILDCTLWLDKKKSMLNWHIHLFLIPKSFHEFRGFQDCILAMDSQSFCNTHFIIGLLLTFLNNL